MTWEDHAYRLDRPHLRGMEAAFALFELHQKMARENFDRYDGRKLSITTDVGSWDGHVRTLTEFFGVRYVAPKAAAAGNLDDFLGRFETIRNGELREVEVERDSEGLYCQGFWPVMRLEPLGSDRFEFSSFPMRLVFRRGADGRVKAMRIRGPYGWGLVGRTLKRADR